MPEGEIAPEATPTNPRAGGWWAACDDQDACSLGHGHERDPDGVLRHALPAEHATNQIAAAAPRWYGVAYTVDTPGFFASGRIDIQMRPPRTMADLDGPDVTLTETLRERGKIPATAKATIVSWSPLDRP